MVSQATLRRVVDNTKQVTDAVTALSEQRLLVGIPDTTARRRDGAISSATIGYTQEFGLPPHLPARPFLLPTVRAMNADIIAKFREMGRLALSGDTKAVDRLMNGLGLEAVSKVRARITSGIAPQLAESTIEARLRRTQAGRKLLGQLRGQGTDLAAWGAQKPTRTKGQKVAGTANAVPLIDTGQLLRSLTYVIRKKPPQAWKAR